MEFVRKVHKLFGHRLRRHQRKVEPLIMDHHFVHCVCPLQKRSASLHHHPPTQKKEQARTLLYVTSI